MYVKREMCRSEGYALFLAKWCETLVGKGVVGIEAVETLAMAHARGRHHGSCTRVGSGVLSTRMFEPQGLKVVDQAKMENNWLRT